MNISNGVKSNLSRRAGSRSAGKIGIFDSGLGGLVIAKAIFKKLPQYNYIYLGDTKHVPYGSRTKAEVYEFTSRAVKYLFDNDCELIIIACNTASALALRKIQQDFLPKYFPNRRVLGVVIPTLEAVDAKYHSKRIGILATANTARSHIYKIELKKINPKTIIFEQGAPKLVPLIEKNALHLSKNALKSYLKPLIAKHVEAIVLACTHYPLLKDEIIEQVGKNIRVISQTEFLPAKVENYLRHHKEIKSKISKNGKKEFLVTAYSKNFGAVAKRLFGKKLDFKVVNLPA
jgi:glutamate racemase